jgi:hypothetical protein
MHMQNATKDSGQRDYTIRSGIIPTRKKDKPTQREPNRKQPAPLADRSRRGWEKAVQICGRSERIYKVEDWEQNIGSCKKRKS